MKLNDLFENSVYEPSDDKINQLNFDDTRKPKLTLKHLNKLRKMREFKKADMQSRKDFWKVMYGSSAEPVGGGMPAF